MDAPMPTGSTLYWKRYKLAKKKVIHPETFEVITMTGSHTAPSFGTGASTKAKLVKSIADAIVSCREIVRREHIKADRIERVQYFVTCLRRHLGYNLENQRASYAAALCEKALWYDIGYPNGTASTKPMGWYSNQVSIRDVHEWSLEAQMMAATKTPSITLAQDIEQDIKVMDASLSIADSLIAEAKAVNTEGDKIIAKMAEVAEGLVGISE